MAWLCETHKVRLEIDGAFRRITVPPPATPERRDQRIPSACVLYRAETPAEGQHGACRVVREVEAATINNAQNVPIR